MTGRAQGYRDLVSHLRFAQKSVVGVPAYMRYVNRPAGGRLAVACHLAGLRPAQVTGISALLSFTAIALVALARPTGRTAAVVACALLLGFAFDSADGQLARLRGGGSPAGEWLDHVVDHVRSSCLHASVAVSLYRFGHVGAVALLLPLAFSIVGGAHYFAMMLRGQLTRAASKGGAPRAGSAQDGTALRAVLLLPLDYGLICLTFFFLALTPLFLLLYAALLVCTAVFSVYSLNKAYRQLSSLQPAAPVPSRA